MDLWTFLCIWHSTLLVPSRHSSATLDARNLYFIELSWFHTFLVAYTYEFFPQSLDNLDLFPWLPTNLAHRKLE